MFLILKHGGGTLQRCDHMEPLQERLIVKTLKRLGHQHPSAKLIPLNKPLTQSSPGMRRFYKTLLPIHSKSKVEPSPCVTLQNLWVSSWLMCNWLDEWPSRSANPSKHRLIKRHRRPWLKPARSVSFKHKHGIIVFQNLVTPTDYPLEMWGNQCAAEKAG